ncbi:MULTISPECIES: hypothetical protein [unclassified Bradyrhizobium]|uniref:hypothetical protein n=1 Tax=unclassified Bradyrhizobium TaxID=2631580 RepID=UPI001BA528B1|nr:MULTISPECIES: hypothetical protein [unclassified Bradyrhizobium]MBR1228505.1 hypothetical protein [Bradyrhizobium sp. AUGA SZCCT0176]MBR1297241.1 hypothetical protein [Bradyrhizobium sp. AUGA SZCCT0042]
MRQADPTFKTCRPALAFAFLMLALAVSKDAHAQSDAPVPQPKDYPAGEVFRGRAAKVDLRPPENREYRTRLREAASQPANFAGHYVLTTWGCGTGCVLGAAVDLKSGKVIFLPGSVCCWAIDVPQNFEPVDFQLQSRLVALNGMINEQGPDGPHYFELANGAFKRVVSGKR